MSIIFERYEERLGRRKRKPSTIRGFKLAANDLAQYLHENDLDPERMDSEQLEEYFAQLDRAPSTKQLHLAHIGAAYRYAYRQGLIPRDPTVDVQIERIPDEPPRTIPNRALREMKEKLFTDREWVAWHLLVYTGMRRHEVLKLRWEDIDLAVNTITVVGKGGKLRHVPIHPALTEVLTEPSQSRAGFVLPGRSRNGQPRSMATRTFWDLVRCITGGKYTPHDFRRTVASSLFENDVNGDLIDEIMGWAPRGTRRKFYQRVAPAKLQRAILQLYRDDPI